MFYLWYGWLVAIEDELDGYRVAKDDPLRKWYWGKYRLS